MRGGDTRPAPPYFSKHEIRELGRSFGQRRIAGARTAEIQKTLPDHQLYGYLGCSAGTLSRRDTQSAWNLAATVRPTIGPSRHFKISPLAGPQTHALLAPGVNLVPILSKVPLGPRLGPSCYRVTADHRENISSR